MHEENFLSSSLREDGQNNERKIMEVDKETKEEPGQKRMREEEKEENETVTPFRLRQEISESGGKSWCDLWDDPCKVSDSGSGIVTSVPVVLAVIDVTVVLVFPSSVVTEVCDGFSLGSDWEFVEPQSFSFSKKCARVWTAT